MDTFSKQKKKKKQRRWWVFGWWVDMRNFREVKCSWGLGSLVRRKQVDSVHFKREGHQLARKLSAIDLIAIGTTNFVSFFSPQKFKWGFFLCLLGLIGWCYSSLVRSVPTSSTNFDYNLKLGFAVFSWFLLILWKWSFCWLGLSPMNGIWVPVFWLLLVNYVTNDPFWGLLKYMNLIWGPSCINRG